MPNDVAWNDEQMSMAQQIVMERFAQNSVAGHLSPESTVDEMETTVRRNRFDFDEGIVVDREVFGLNEPFSFCRFSQAQVEEFARAQGEALKQTKVVTTLTRASSSLARWHDILFFRGFAEGRTLKPDVVEMPAPASPPQSLREAAMEAEKQAKPPIEKKPVPVNDPPNEGLVPAVYDAVLRLESRGYFSEYHVVLGETLWRALHTPTSGSMVLPRERIEPTLMGGSFFRTTVLPEKEALVVSLDGPTFDCVIAGDPARYPRFEFLRVEANATNHEELYLFRVRERFAPRVRENRSIVRLEAK
jgi:Encapsulating protein for peroxidase